MTDEQQTAIDTLRSGNLVLANLVKEAVKDAVHKSAKLITQADTAIDLLNAIKALETSTKIVGLSPKETQTNIQINAINGFSFIEIDSEDIKQLVAKEDFEEGEYDED
jgi:hypothetical protein